MGILSSFNIYREVGIHMPSVIERKVYKAITTVLMLGLTLFVTAVAQAATVTGVQVQDSNGKLEVTVAASGAVQYKAKNLADKIVVDVFPAKLKDGVVTSQAINKGLVENLKVEQYDANTVRVLVDVISQPEYSVYTANNQVFLAVSTSEIANPGGKSASNPVVAKAKPITSEPSVMAPMAVPTVAPVASAQVAPSVSRVSLDFVNADLVYVLKVLAKEMGRNIYIAPHVQGDVTVTLNRVPVEGAMALILRMQENEFDYKVADDTIIVAAPDTLSQIPDDILGAQKAAAVPFDAVRREFSLNRAPSDKVTGFLQSQYPRVKFIAHPTVNGFYAVGSEQDLNQIQSELANLDQAPPAPAPPQREFVRVNYGEASEVAGMLAAMVPDVNMTVDERQGMIIMDGAPGAVDTALELLGELDRPREQVMIDMKVVDLSETGQKDLGVTWGGTAETEGQYNIGMNEADGVDFLESFTIGSLERSPITLNASIQFLISQNLAKSISSPRLLCLSGENSELHVGDNFPIVYFDSRAGQFQVTYVPIGITMNVVPEVKSDGWITMELNPKFSSLVDLIQGQYPRTSDRKVSTFGRVRDGDTIVIGGLVQESELTNVSKVPLLGDLPLIGTLFRNTSTSLTRSEVVVMVTPTIIR